MKLIFAKYITSLVEVAKVTFYVLCKVVTHAV